VRKYAAVGRCTKQENCAAQPTQFPKLREDFPPCGVVACNSLSDSVYNPPSNPVAQFPEAFAILVAHDNQTRLGVLGDVGGFVGVAIDLDHAAGGRPSNPIEDQSAFYFAAGRTLKCMMLIAGHHHGVVPNYLHQTHLSAARYTTHRAYSPPDKVGFNGAMKMWSNTDVTRIIHKHVYCDDCGIRRRVLRATPSSVQCGQVVRNRTEKKKEPGKTLSRGLVHVPSARSGAISEMSLACDVWATGWRASCRIETASALLYFPRLFSHLKCRSRQRDWERIPLRELREDDRLVAALSNVTLNLGIE